MNLDGTPLVVDPKNMGAASTEVKSFTSEDLEWALAKQKEEHDASLEALVQMRPATLTMMLAPLSGGAASRPTVPTPSLGQQPPRNDQTSVPWLYARPQIERKSNPSVLRKIAEPLRNHFGVRIPSSDISIFTSQPLRDSSSCL